MVEQGQGISHRTIRAAGNVIQSLFFDLVPIQLPQFAHPIDDRLHGHPFEIIPLASGQYGNRYFVYLGRRQNENHIRRRFLQRFQQRIECRCREHMYLVDDINFITAFCRRIFNFADQLPHLFNTAVGRRINFDHIHRIAGCDGRTGCALSTRTPVRLRMLTIDSRRENPCYRRLSRAPCPRKQIGVPDTVCMQLIFQCPNDMLLPFYIIECMRAVSPV